MQKKFKVVTLGCRTNQYESQGYRDQLLEMGYTQAEEDGQADICIVNTCTVTESADKSSRYEIRQLAKRHPEAKLVVTGCSAEQHREAIQSIPGVTAVISNKDKENLLPLIFPEEEIPEFSIKHFEAHTRAFVKVQDGCNSFCTYCIIPYVRGRSRSRTLEDVLQEVRGLVANGFKEVVLTGINIGDFDGQGTHNLADLIRAVDGVQGLERLRVSSIDPDEVDDNLMDAIIHGKTTCPSMHIVLQAGSNVILKRMNRKYTRQVFMNTVDRLKKASSDFTFTTDIIVGFPGETEEDFEQTLEVMREVKFAKVHMFPYSPRERTRAALYGNKIASEVMQRRKQEVMRLAEEIGYDLRNQYLNRRMKVLVEAKDTGHTENFLPVILQDDTLTPNQIVTVDLVSNRADGLVGRICHD